MHTKIHSATRMLCVHFQFSFHRDVEVTRALSTRKALFLVYFQPLFLVQFLFKFSTKLSHKSAFLSLFFHSPRALVALKKLKKTRRCLNPAAGARDRRITALKK